MGQMGQMGHKRRYQSHIELVAGGSFKTILNSNNSIELTLV